MSINAAELALIEENLSAPQAESHTHTSNFINRDLSLIEFQRRVLEEALDQSLPILERLKFIAIFSSITDEFFMIRVSGLKEKLGREVGVSSDGYTTHELLAEIKSRISDMIADQMDCLQTDVLPKLEKEGISVVKYASLADTERHYLNEYFYSHVYPLLTPQAVDPTHPFPYISGGSINIGLLARPTLNKRSARVFQHHDGEFFVRIKIPAFVPRFVPLKESPNSFIRIEDLTVANVRRLVPEATPESCHFFRITRDADLEVREAETEDLMESMEENLKLRRFGYPVRLEVSSCMPQKMVEYLTASLKIEQDDVYTLDGPLDAAAFMDLYKIKRPELKFTPLKVFTPPVLSAGENIFDVIRRQDILLHHPYNPYSIVTDLLAQAAEDPDVLAIKMCLYRIGAESPIAPLLIKASENGKQVTALIEIKARFDESNNIEWAKKLEEAGVHVVYGLLGLKTHCKTTLIIRREGEDLKRYIHLATGNYNPQTSAFYTDLGLLTCDDEIGADATELFNYLTVYSQREKYKKLIVAPIYLRQKMLKLIEREIGHAEAGRPSGIVAKMNRLADSEIVNALYRASQAGVKIDLIIRGICTLRPGVKGLSENIRVRSIVGNLLEHSRLYCFTNGGNYELLTGSADWMPRNLDRRVEVLTPVTDPEIKKYLKDEFLATYLADNVRARELKEDGSYSRITPEPGEDRIDSQLAFQHLPAGNILKFQYAR